MNMVTSIKTKLIILITCTFWMQLVLANRTICPDKKVQIPKEIKALKLLTANFVVTNNSIETMNKYNNIFVSNSKKKVLDYSLTKHIYLLIDINTNIQLSNNELSIIQDFILKLNRNELDERLINNLNVLKTLVEFRLAEKDELLDADVIQSFKDIKFETLLKYFSVYTQKGLIRELSIKIKKPPSKFIEIALNYSKKKSKLLNLLKAKNFNKRRITREIKVAITNNLLSMSYRDDPDRRLNRRLSYDYTIWLIKQLGLHLNNTKEILLNLKSDIWFYNQKELEKFIKEHRVIYMYGKVESYARTKLGYFVKTLSVNQSVAF